MSHYHARRRRRRRGVVTGNDNIMIIIIYLNKGPLWHLKWELCVCAFG